MGRYRAIYTENQNGDGYEAEKNKTEKIWLRRKLIAVVSCMLIIGIAVQSRFAVKAVKRMVREQAETALVDKAEAVADMLDKETAACFQYAEVLAHAPVLNDRSIPNSKKAKIVYEQTAFNDAIRGIVFCDMDGHGFINSGERVSALNEEWFSAAASGKYFVSEPTVFSSIDTVSFIFAVPIHMGDKITGVLSMIVSSDFFSKKIEPITVGYTGYCSVLGSTGIIIADVNQHFVENKYNIISEAAADESLASFKVFIETALTGQTGVGRYTFMQLPYMAAYSTMQTTGWTVILKAPELELTGAAKKFTSMVVVTSVLFLVVAITIVGVAIRKMV